MAVALGRGGPYAAQGVGIMSRVIAVIACGFTLAGVLFRPLAASCPTRTSEICTINTSGFDFR
jgi:hypothetical protein